MSQPERHTETPRHCPALMVSGSSSGLGKTTVTAALARYHRDRGRKVRAFKTGPDFLDPMILARASGAPVYQLDLWMGGEDHCRRLIYEAAGDADLILVEGVMGLFDGDCSSADLAALFGIPVLAVIDGSAMAQTFGAIAHGLATYRPEVPFAGVFANRVAGEGHYQMLSESLPPALKAFGWLAGDEGVALPERHLGLVQAGEVRDLDERIGRAASAIHTDGTPPAPVAFEAPPPRPTPPRLEGVRIAVARDAAFAFLYPANLDLLSAMGASLEFFSPLADGALPACDALYLPGGYPELHIEALAANESMKAAVRAHHDAGRPLVAECGGMMYLLESLTGTDGATGRMAGLLPGHTIMQVGLANLGMQSVRLPEGELRGHTFHHSRMQSPLEPVALTAPGRHHGAPEAVYRRGRLTASYLHSYFPSNPEAAAGLFLP